MNLYLMTYNVVRWQVILTDLNPIMQNQQERSCAVNLQYKLLLTLWTLGNQESFRQIGDRFDTNRGAAYRYFTQVLQTVLPSISNIICRIELDTGDCFP
jgi:hypothetical protein